MRTDSRTPGGGWTVVVPVKPAAMAKSRLRSIAAPQRLELAQAFTRDALTAVLASPLVAGVIVVGDTAGAPDDDRVRSISDPHADLSTALDLGLNAVDQDHRVAVVVCDLPAVRPEEITMALTSGASHHWSMICDRAGTGTTMLMSLRHHDLQHRFGHRSRAAHVALGAIDLAHLPVPGLRCDVDTEVDLWDAQRLGVGTNTRALLDS